MSWNDARDEALRACCADGMSFAEAAISLNSKFGTRYSRNALIGRAARKGIAAANPGYRPGVSAKKIAQKRAPRTPKNPKPLVQFACEPVTELLHADVVPLNLSIYELTDETCRWPYGDDPPYAYCGHRPLEGLPYCAAHTRLGQGRVK